VAKESGQGQDLNAAPSWKTLDISFEDVARIMLTKKNISFAPDLGNFLLEKNLKTVEDVLAYIQKTQ